MNEQEALERALVVLGLAAGYTSEAISLLHDCREAVYGPKAIEAATDANRVVTDVQHRVLSELRRLTQCSAPLASSSEQRA